jgi:uncharacterized protein
VGIVELFIPDLKKAKGRFLKFYAEIKVSGSGVKAYQDNDPVLKVSLQAAYVNNRVLIKGNWQAGFLGECSRCLEQTNFTLRESFAEEFIHLQAGEGGGTAGNISEKDEQFLFKGELLKLDEYFRQSFFLSLPLKILCHEDCKGLCPICGQNKNKSSCSCTDESTDQRWTPLKHFIEKDSGGV